MTEQSEPLMPTSHSNPTLPPPPVLTREQLDALRAYFPRIIPHLAWNEKELGAFIGGQLLIDWLQAQHDEAAAGAIIQPE